MEFSKENFELLQKQNERMKGTIAHMNDEYQALIEQIKDDVGSLTLINQFSTRCSIHHTHINQSFISHNKWLASWENEPHEVHEMYDYMIRLIPYGIKKLIQDHKKLNNDRTARYGEYQVIVYTAKSPTGRMIKEFDNMESHQ